MKLFRLTGLAALALLLTGCGDTFRPVVNPINQAGGVVTPLSFAVTLHKDPGGGAGAATQINVGGDTVTSNVFVRVNPVHAAFVSGFAKVAVANFTSKTVSIYDPSTPATCPDGSCHDIGVGVKPVFVLASPDGTKVYVANSGDGTVSVIDPSGAVVTAIICLNGVGGGGVCNPGPPNPLRMTLSPAATKVYVANDDGSVTVIKVTDNTVKTTIAAPGDAPVPAWIANNANTTNPQVFVLYHGLTNRVAVIDAADAADAFLPVAPPLTVDLSSNYMAFDPIRHFLYVTGIKVNVVDDSAPLVPVLKAPVAMPDASAPLSLTPLVTGSTVYIATDAATACGGGAGGRVYALDATALTTSCITVGASPVWIASSSDASKVYVAHQGAGIGATPPGTTIIKTSTNTVCPACEIAAPHTNPADITTPFELPVFVTAAR